MNSITIAVEPWERLRGEIWPLWQAHHAEIAKDGDRIPLSPDWERYDAHAAAGILHILAARADGKLVGYLFAMVATHMHYSTTLCAFFDLYWLDPAHRLTGEEDSLDTLDSVGAQLFLEAEDSLRKRGVRKIFGQTKIWQDNSKLFDLLGWKEVERIYSREVKD